MDNGGMVRKYIRAERKARGWNQRDLARAAGIKSKTTIVELEAGRRLSEGNEGAVERALGWKIGSLDRIRDGGEPIPADAGGELTPRDDFERKVFESILPTEEKLEWVRAHRAALEEERRLLRPRSERHPNSAIVSNGSDTNRQ